MLISLRAPVSGERARDPRERAMTAVGVHPVRARLARALARLERLSAALPNRMLAASLLASTAAVVPRLAGYPLACAEKFAAIAALLAVPTSLALVPPRPPRAGGPGRRHRPAAAGRLDGLEAGFTYVELLVAAALLAMVIFGASVVFSGQKQMLTRVTIPDTLRDQVSAVEVDASALQAYDSSVQAKIQNGGTQAWSATIPGTTQLSTLQATPQGAGLDVVSQSNGQYASAIAPLPSPKPMPQ
jgi:hypothetical protein